MKINDSGARKLATRIGMPVRNIFQTPSRPKPTGPIGYVDQFGPNFVRGWAADRDQPGTSLHMRVYLDDSLVAEGDASVFREDLRAAGYGEGLHGYQLPLPAKALFCATHITFAAVAPSGEETVFLRQSLREAAPRAKPVVYFDASDLIEFLSHHREMSGIQRVQAGYLLSLGDATIGDATCRICTRFKYLNFYFEVPHATFAKLLEDAGNLSAVAKGAWSDHVHHLKLGLTRRATISPGDCVFTLGAPWALDQHNEIIRCVKFHYGARYYQIFYDLIPISVPEVVAAPLIPHFARAMAAMATYADHVFSISDFSRRDLADTLVKLGRPVPETSVVPMGGSITDSETVRSPEAGTLARLGVSAPYVLCVGTLEPRKNHALLFQVWRRLVAQHGALDVPKLVLVGRVGWYMEDFMRMLKVTSNVEGTIVHLEGISNAELAELYDRCLFTVFPSYSEGWGLPITESFAHGKACVCSNVASMPEAGGTHALYIDPFDISGVYGLCDKLIYDGETLAAAEREIRTTFKPQTWREASQGLLTQLSELVARPARDAVADRRPIVLGRLYKFFNIEAAEANATALTVFANFLDQEDALDLMVGWNWFDLDVNCTWACGQKAEISIVPPPGFSGELVAYVEVIAPPAYDGIACTISIDGRRQGEFTQPRHASSLALTLHVTTPGQPISITLEYVEYCRATGPDTRQLGVGLRTVMVFDRADVEGRLGMLESVFVTKTKPSDVSTRMLKAPT